MEQTGVILKKDWYGNKEGTEIWDLDAGTMAKLVNNSQAEYTTRQATTDTARFITEETPETDSRRRK
jgi:sRNA-binding protein